jgi:amino acid adenylation domain-containing protein
MTKANIVASYPLSSMQQGMLLHSLNESGAYIEQTVCDLREELDLGSLLQVWKRVINHHAILRTAFDWQRVSEPIQEVYAGVEVPSLTLDWRDASPDIQRQRFDDYLRADRLKGVDATTVPLMRFAFFRLADRHYRMIWTFHHALIDGRSHLEILREVFTLYDASPSGNAPQLKTRRPYADYINWLAEKDWSAAQAFWRQDLSGFTPPPELRVVDGAVPLMRHAPPYSLQTLKLSEQLTANLKLVATQNQITLNTMVQASWALLLSRYYGSEDVVFGATRACRHATVAGAGLMVGLFINTLPMRVSVKSERPVREWLKDLRAKQIALRDFENTPLPKIQKWSDAGGQSLFETVLVFENYELNEQVQQLAGWQHRRFELREQTHYPLTLAAYSGANLLLKLEYDERRFDSTSIKRMLGHLNSLLEGMAANLDRTVGQLSILTGAERRQIVHEWNQTESLFSDKCLHQLFSEQTKRTPNAVAVVFEDEEISFDDLNKRVNQLAHHLIARGIGPEVLVGVFMERSIELVVALLAVLKAGGAYVPLDPGYPAERLSFMLTDAEAKVLLTQRHLAQDWHGDGVETIYLQRGALGFSGELTEEPNNEVGFECPAYVIYTSGSTGQPKGSVLTHRAVSNHMQWMQQEFPLSASDSVLQKTPISFDASVWEFYAPLLAGARLVMAVPEGHRSTAYLVRIIQDYRITTLQLGPSLLRVLMDEKGFSKCESLRNVFCGGEPLTLELSERFSRNLPAQLINLYGPTEVCIDTTFWIVNRQRCASSVPIGRPIANTTAYVLDQRMEPVPVGISGELYLGGAGLGRGYLHRPDLTAERFVPHPFSDAPGARLYRTGDITRYLSDGNILYLGRADHQVKLRGVRIELGEIESVLARHPKVRQCVVAMRDERDGQGGLSAYVVSGSERPDSNELRAFIRNRLPESMVPSAFVYLEQLPLTANGKVDRSALPAPRYARENNGYVAPRDATEAAVANIWSEVLKLDRVGVLDDFLELGGDSLQAMQVISRTAAAFQIDLTLDVFFKSRTIAGLAGALQEALFEEVSQIAEDEG